MIKHTKESSFFIPIFSPKLLFFNDFCPPTVNINKSKIEIESKSQLAMVILLFCQK